MSDSIKRSDAIKALGEEPYVWTDDDEFAQGERSQWIDDVSAIKAVPSADRPQGEWIDKGKNLWECSKCGMVIYSESEQDRNEFHKWCSRCGAQMKGADDETD